MPNVMTRRFIVPVLAVTIAACADAPLPTQPATAPDAGPASTSVAAEAETFYVIAFKGNKLPADAAEIVAAAGGTLVKALPQVAIGVASSADPAFAEKLAGHTAVEAADASLAHPLPETAMIEADDDVDGAQPVESHATAPNSSDNLYHLQWGIRRVNAPAAWATTSGSHATTVGIIDTGVAWNSPDLAPNMQGAYCFALLTATCNPYPSLHWHGTHVAGTVGAAFGHGRGVGVGPNLGLVSYNVFESIPGCGTCAFSFNSWQAMIHAAENGVDVVNLSLGGYGIRGPSNANWLGWNRVANYVDKLGLVVVASQGNGNADLNGRLFHAPSDVPGVIGAGATGIRPLPQYPQAGAFDVRAYYSNFGAAVDVTAPGGDCGPSGCSVPYFILSNFVFLNAACAAAQSCPTGYAWSIGTSMSSPHIAGVAGLARDAHPGLSPNQVKALLKRTAEDLGDRQQFGHGMVDAAAAVK